MTIAQTMLFYDIASDNLLDAFEDALDTENRIFAYQIRNDTIGQYMRKEAKSFPYLEDDPSVGDMVFSNSFNRYYRLLAISDDRKKALIKDQFGVFPVGFETIRRVQ